MIKIGMRTTKLTLENIRSIYALLKRKVDKTTVAISAGYKTTNRKTQKETAQLRNFDAALAHYGLEVRHSLCRIDGQPFDLEAFLREVDEK